MMKPGSRGSAYSLWFALCIGQQFLRGREVLEMEFDSAQAS
jgi:hypothetical protein